MMVFELPPRLSFSNQVNTESRYGMKVEFRLAVGSLGLLLSLANDEITNPRVTKLLLICAPSFRRSPVAPVASARSLFFN